MLPLPSRTLLTALLLSVPAFAAPTGKIGFIGAKGAQILNLQKNTCRFLPQGSKATTLALSPGGTAIYFVPVAGAKPKADDTGAPANGLQSLPPYSSVRPLGALRALVPYSQWWDPTGTTLYLSTDKLSGAFRPATGRLTWHMTLPDSFDARRQKLAYTTETQVIVRDVATNRNWVLFDIRKPAPMFAALKAAKNPKNVKDLLDMMNDPMVKESSNWQLSEAALSPDASRLYFTSNAGTGMGASGNAAFVLFAVDLRTNSLAALSKVGTNFGRSPHIMQVSPDGKRLLMASSAHSSAADNSCFVKVIDLLTQNSREVFVGVLPGSKGQANFLDSAVWSPDGKYVAQSGYFYNPEKMMSSYNGKWPEVKPAQYTTGIVDAATGRLVKTIKGATSLNWVR